MKKLCLCLWLALPFLGAGCKGVEQVGPEQPASSGCELLSLEDVAQILSELPLEEQHLREVHDAVGSSSGNGYDEEYMMSDLFANPGAGVGSDGRPTKAGSYASPLRDLFEDYFSKKCATRAGGSPDADAYIEALRSSDIQIYWPYSEDWDGAFPIITFDPGYGAESNTGYEVTVDADGNRKVSEVYVDEAVAASRPVWVVNTNDDSAFTPLDLITSKAGESTGTSSKKLMLKTFTMLRNYDSWFGGGSEFFVKCGSASGFKATNNNDLKLYTPSVTDFMVVVRRSELKKEVTMNTILVSDFTDEIDKVAFLVIEDDGGETTSWKCAATVKYMSKTYGFDLEIPYKDKDDVVWRGQLSGDFFRTKAPASGRFGDVKITFALE